MCVVLCSLPACGEAEGAAIGSGAGAGGAGSGGSAALTTPNAGAGGNAAGGAASTGGAGPLNAGGAPNCSSYVDDAGWSLQIEIQNASSQTLHLGPQQAGCSVAPLFQVEDGSRTVLPSLGACPRSCQAVIDGSAVQCTLACPSPTTVTLAPGQSVKLPWDGRFASPQTLSPVCLRGASDGNTECVNARRIEAGAFTFSAQAGTVRRCLDTAAPCACAQASSGGCTTPGSLVAGTIITTELFTKLEPGELSPSGEPPHIGLVFHD